MEVDEDLDANLIGQFRSLGTTDRDVLVAELQKLLGKDVNPRVCAFFLDMNDWNLQAAVGSYYDFEQPIVECVPAMTLVRDVTIGEGESVQPNVTFTKTWRIKNTGSQAWPPGCSLRFLQGGQFGPTDRVLVGSLAAGEEADVSVDMTSPQMTGLYQGQWRMCTSLGTYFGDIIWVILSVAEDGLLNITQQMSRFGSDLMSTSARSIAAANPFRSPTVSSFPVQTSPVDTFHAPTPSGSSLPPTMEGLSDRNQLNGPADHYVQLQSLQQRSSDDISGKDCGRR